MSGQSSVNRFAQTKVVLHKLTKTRFGKPEMLLGKKLLSPDGPAGDLVERIRNLYTTRHSVSTGAFEVAMPGIQRGLTDFEAGRIHFLQMTHNAMGVLNAQITGVNLSTSGYVLFTVYTYNERSYFMCTMLHDVNGKAISDTLDVTENIHIDLDKLHMGARVDLTAWRAKEHTHLTFIRGRVGTEEVSQYFLRFIGCTQVSSSSENSRRIVAFVGKYLASTNWPQATIEDRRAACYQFCAGIAKTKMPFLVATFANVLDRDNPDAVIVAAGADGANLNDGGTLTQTPLRGLLWVQASDEDVSIKFKRQLFGDKVLYDEQDRQLTIHGISDKLHKAIVEATSDVADEQDE